LKSLPQENNSRSPNRTQQQFHQPTKENKMKIRNAKRQLIESKIRELGGASKAWADVFGHVMRRLDDSLREDGFHLVLINGTLCHVAEVYLAEIYTACPQHPDSTLRNALRYLQSEGYLLYDAAQQTVPGTARTLSAPEFVIADTAQLLGLLYAQLGRPLATAASDGSQRCFQ